MKRRKIPVILSHKDGRRWTLGYRSSRTRAVMCAAVKDAAEQFRGILGCRDYEFIFVPGLRAQRGEWELSFGPEEEA